MNKKYGLKKAPKALFKGQRPKLRKAIKSCTRIKGKKTQ